MPILHHAVLRLAEVCREVVVVLSPEGEEPPLPVASARFARDATEGDGPLSGLFAGLRAVRAELALVAAGDMPELRVPVLAELVRTAGESTADAIALRDGERVAVVPCVVRVEPARATAGALLGSGRRRFRDLLDALDVAVLEEPAWVALDPDRRTLFDVDEPSDLAD